MKNSLLLLMTPNMSLEKWDELGQLSRELNYYDSLCKKANLNLIIYSYGRNDNKYLSKYPTIKVLCMPPWISTKIPYTLQNLIYNLSSLFFLKSYFRRVLLAKTNQFSASTFGLLLKIFFKIPLVIRMGYYYSHFKKNSYKTKLIERLHFKLCDLILTTSVEAANYITHTYNIPASKILSMCNTVNLNVFKPLAIPKTYDLIFIGRLEQQKDIKLLLKVASLIDLKMLVIGKGSLAQLVKDAVNKHVNIIYKTKVDNADLPMYYNSAKCFIIVSEYEGNPKVLLEAMACGIPVIGTNVPGIRECIIDNVNGILINNIDAEQIKQQILKLFANEIEMNRLGCGASKWTNAQCNLVKNIATEVNFYFNYLDTGNLAYSN
ncbi:glycosyltransferase family 4 protein [Pedobacter sp. B4-66]|uniref:glycosyltransferase family 4 protein n=1 Tax=Pedobacter sp. B4-66 TaxID=2817280 RepID=UPI001BD9D635|nr:glycosyltransferase family 4 protein [Pedobacter sp. B4-66]